MELLDVKVDFAKARNIITKSNIPGIDYAINPYIGCQHACIYCYAEFMKRFTNHSGETWGEFVDVKQFEPKDIEPEKYDDKTILISSVTDPYTPLEVIYKNTQKVLEHLVGTKANIQILTKSSLVTRDIDLFKEFASIEVGISLNTLDEEFAKIIEPRASKPQARLEALKKVAGSGIPTYVFVSPIFPWVSNWREVVESARSITGDFRFENLNFRGHNIPRIMGVIGRLKPELLDLYEHIRTNSSLWDDIEQEIVEYCDQIEVKCKIEFHQGGFTKSKS